MNVAVRPARRADAAGVADFWQALIDAHAALDPTFALRDGARAGLESAIAHALDDPDAGLWVADREGVAVGFCAAHVDRAASPLVEHARAELTELWVTPASRRSGIGRALADAALAWAVERGAVRIEVRVAFRNGAGQAFWRALGFGDFVDVLDRRL